jgi:hypothetical protein
MPVLSAFTPCGALACSSVPSRIEQFYRQLPTLWGSELDFTPGVATYDEAKLYAVARMLGLALGELEHAGNQAYPLRAYDLLPLLELDLLLTPGPLDTVQARQSAVAAAELLPRGEIASNVTNALRTLLGAPNFFAYVRAPGGNYTTVNIGNFADVRVQPRLVQLVDPTVASGTVWVGYRNWDASVVTPVLLNPGDRVVVDAGNSATGETVTVIAVSGSTQMNTMPGSNYFQAAFAHAHGVGAPALAGNYPLYWGTGRLSLVVVSAATANSGAVRVQANALMARLTRAVEQFAIVQPSSTTLTGGTVGPFAVGLPMGISTVGTINYTNSM